MKTMRYVYKLTHIMSGRVYIGCRYAKKAHPDEFFVSYFTSSRVIKEIIETEGVGAFEHTLLWVGGTKEQILEIESEQILEAKEVLGSNMVINQHVVDYSKQVGDKRYFGIYIMTEEIRKKISESNKGIKKFFDEKWKERNLKHMTSKSLRDKQITSIKTPQARKNNSLSRKEYYKNNPEQMERFHSITSEKLSMVPKSPEHCKAISEGQKRLRLEQGAIWRSNRAQSTKHVWGMAQDYYDISKLNPKNNGKGWGHEKFCTHKNNNENVRIFWRMREMFKEGWIPEEDEVWVEDFR